MQKKPVSTSCDWTPRCDAVTLFVLCNAPSPTDSADPPRGQRANTFLAEEHKSQRGRVCAVCGGGCGTRDKERHCVTPRRPISASRDRLLRHMNYSSENTTANLHRAAGLKIPWFVELYRVTSLWFTVTFLAGRAQKAQSPGNSAFRATERHCEMLGV